MKRINPKLLIALGWLLCTLLLVGGLILGIRAIRSYGHSTIWIEWATASELETVGFNILRSENESGPFDQINLQPIPSAEDPLTGGEYRYEDDEVAPGKTYYYFLEEVEASGNKTTHGPIRQKAKDSAGLNLLLAGILIASSGFYTWLLTRPGKKESIKNDDRAE